MLKKSLFITLLILGILIISMTVINASNSVGIYIGGAYVDDTSGDSENGWYWDSTTNTLTLDGYEGYPIQLESQTEGAVANIHLKGANNIIGTATNDTAYGILYSATNSKLNITAEENASLIINSVCTEGGYANGIQLGENTELVISSGDIGIYVEATGYDANGILIPGINSKVTIEDEANVNIISNSKSRDAFGIYASNIEITTEESVEVAATPATDGFARAFSVVPAYEQSKYDVNGFSTDASMKLTYVGENGALLISSLDEYQNAISEFQKENISMKLTSDLDITNLYVEGTDSEFDVIHMYADKVLDLNGNTLICDNAHLKLWFYGDYTFTIIDSSQYKTGRIYSDNISVPIIEAMNVENDSNYSIEIDSGTLEYSNNEAPEMILLGETASGETKTLKINDATFIGGTNLVRASGENDVAAINIIKMVRKTAALDSDVKLMNSDLTVGNIIDSGSKLIVDGNLISTDTILSTVEGQEFVVEEYDLISAIDCGSDKWGTVPEETKITIENKKSEAVNITGIEIDSENFEVIGTTATIASGTTDNTSFGVKPKEGLWIGTYTAEVTLTDSKGNKHTAQVTYEVEKAESLVVVNKEQYKEAIKYTDVTTVKLGANITLDELAYGENSWQVKGNDRIFDLNGYQLTLTGINDNFEVEYYTSNSLTITDSTNSTTAKIVQDSTGQYDEVIELFARASVNYKLIIDGGTYEAPHQDRVIYMYDISAENAGNYSRGLEIVRGNFVSKSVFAPNNSTTENKLDINIKTMTITNPTGVSNNVWIATLSGWAGTTLADVIDEKSEIVLADIIEEDLTKTVTDFSNGKEDGIRVRRIEGLEIENVIFENASLGYTAVESKNIVISNISLESSLTVIDVILSGESSGDFVLEKPTTAPTIDYGESNSEYKITPINNLGVGTHTTEIVAIANGREFKATATFVVEKAELVNPSVVIDGWMYGDYDDIANAPKVLIDGNEYSEDVTYEYKLSSESDEEYTSVVPESVGEYTVRATIAETENYKEAVVTSDFEIIKKQLEVSVSEITSKDFDNTLTVPTESIVLEFSGATLESGDYEVSGELATEADKYVGTNRVVNVTVRLVDAIFENYEFADNMQEILISGEMQINAIQPVFATVPNDVENEDTTTAVLTIGQSGDIAKYVELTPAEYQDEVTFIIDGSYTGVSIDDNVLITDDTETVDTVVKLIAKFASKDLNNDNEPEYEESSKEFYVKIIAKETVIISGLTYADKNYDGTAIMPEGTLVVSENKVDVSELEIKYVGVDGTVYESGESPINAGKYQVTYSVPSTNLNYAGSVTYTFEIRKAVPIITAGNLSQKVGNVTAVTYEVTPNVSSEKVIVEYEQNGIFGTILPSTTGTYKVKISVSGDSNIEDTSKEFTLTISAETSGVGGGSGGGGGGGSTAETINVYKITVENTTGGTISPETTKVKEGEDIVFTIKADNGYEISDVLVDGKSVGKVSEYTFENVDEKHEITARFKKLEVSDWINPFKDVSTSDWFYEAVAFTNQNGLLNGITEDTFGPDVDLTRGMIVTILYRHSKAETTKYSTFNDVNRYAYYSNAIAWAADNGIVNGIGDNLFAPDTEITREQLVTILYRYAKYLNRDVSDRVDITNYEDANKVGTYAMAAMEWAVANKLVSGRTATTLAPQGTASRAEVATILMRFCK